MSEYRCNHSSFPYSSVRITTLVIHIYLLRFVTRSVRNDHCNHDTVHCPRHHRNIFMNRSTIRFCSSWNWRNIFIDRSTIVVVLLLCSTIRFCSHWHCWDIFNDRSTIIRCCSTWHWRNNHMCWQSDVPLVANRTLRTVYGTSSRCLLK